MSSHLRKCVEKNLVSPPKWVVDNLMFEGITGSVAYGCNDKVSSDMDIIGFCMPKKEIIFPHTAGYIPGFGTQPPAFGQYVQHHIKSEKYEYDFTIYSIVKFFQLCMDNNPNMVDALFLPRRCVTHSTEIYELVRENRDSFLHKGSWHKFKGYAYSQLSKMRGKSNKANPKRQKSIDEHGYDTKFAYHIVRLILEVEQILAEHTLDIERNSQVLIAIRNGEWSLERIEQFFIDKERSLEGLYNGSALRYSPDEKTIKSLLMKCFEMHYGSIDEMINVERSSSELKNEMIKLLERY